MSKTASLNDHLELDGYWWIHDKPEDKVTGTLSFDQKNGVELKLLGLFGGIPSFNRQTDKSFVIHGITKDGKIITLLNSFIIHQQMNAPGIFNETYYASFLCIGYHFTSEKDDIFFKSFFRFDRLEEWLLSNPFREEWDFETRDFNLQVNHEKSLEMNQFSEYKFGKSSTTSTTHDSTKHIVEVLSYLYCETEKPKSLQWHLTTASRMQELASLCTGHYLPLNYLKLLPKNNQETDNKRLISVEVFIKIRHPHSGNRPKHEAPLISFIELLKSNSKSIENWFDQYEIIEPVINLFFTVTSEADMFVNIKFLLSIQALEVFHRRTSTGLLVSKEEYKDLRKILVSLIPEKLENNFKEKLTGLYAHANEISLFQRLNLIIEEINADFDKIVPGFSEPYARLLVNTRNYNTHFDSSLENKSLDPIGMHWASRRIILMISYLLLKKIGIQPNDFLTVLDRHHEFKSLFHASGNPT